MLAPPFLRSCAADDWVFRNEGSTKGLGPFAQNVDIKNTNNTSNNCRKSSNNEIDIINSSSQSYNETSEL